jgi:hypothetical protein
MKKLYTIDYNEQQKRLPNRVQHYSRNNFYVFHYNDEQRDLDFFTNKYEIESIIDYGCGFGHSTDYLNLDTQKYDPFIPEYEKRPDRPADLVVCYNVLNVIEEQFMYDVVDDIYNLSKKIVLINVAIRDKQYYGERSFDWYLNFIKDRFSNKFEIIEYYNKPEFDKRSFNDSSFYFLLKRKNDEN